MQISRNKAPAKISNSKESVRRFSTLDIVFEHVTLQNHDDHRFMLQQKGVEPGDTIRFIAELLV